MPSELDIRRRIASVKNTRKITRVMKMAAAAKLRRAQEAIARARPYAYYMRDITHGLVARADPGSHALLRPGRADAVGVVAVTSDRGLCGAFNANIVNETMRKIREDFQGKEVALTVVGRKGVEAFRRRACNIRATHAGVFDEFSINAAFRIVNDVVDDFNTGHTGAIYCIYNEFKSAVAQQVACEPLLPYTPRGDEYDDGRLYYYEPSEEALLFELLVRNIHVQMYRILHESATSEHGARMAAMDAATRNAGEVIGKLTLEYNRARQDAITREVIEVVSGAQAL